jgi:tryptophan halogenase
MDDDTARSNLLNDIEGEMLTEPRLLRFRTGTRRAHWHRNCVSIGLSSGFIEPLESTSIHLIQRSIMRLMRMFPKGDVQPSDVEEFNRQTFYELDHIRDFIILHYNLTNRTDSEFWNHVRTMDIPDSLRHRMQLFEETGRTFRANDELFAENSWTQVMLGQGIMPQSYHPIVDMMSPEEMKSFLSHITSNVDKTVAGLPMHQTYLEKYCSFVAAT